MNRRLLWIGAVVAALHAAGWGLVALHAAAHPGLAGAALLSYTLGLRHAFDADHLAAIDNTTRRLRDHGERPVAVGFFFAIGHASVVVVMMVVLALVAAAHPESNAALGTVGSTIAGVFLLGIGALNLLALRRLLLVARRAGRADADADEILRLAGAQGLLGRLGAGRLTRRVVRSWHMLPLGLLFGLGFETATEVAVLGLGAGAAAGGLPLAGVLSIPLVFAAGMVTVDSLDGLLMGRAYEWALAHPLRRLSYNVVVTLVSVGLALLVAVMNLLPLAGVDAAWLDYQVLGYVATGLLLACWLTAAVLWRVLRVEERWVAPTARYDHEGDPVIVVLTTADTEILATAHAVATLPDGFGRVRCANPAGVTDVDAFLDDVLDGARVVVCRLLGGRRAWPEGVDALRARCRRDGIALLLLAGEAEPDAELAELSLAPAGALAQAFEYLRHGGVENTAHLLRFLADALLLQGHGFEDPQPLADLGVHVPGRGDAALEDAVAQHDPGRPTVGIVFYRSHRATGNVAFVDALAQAVEAAGANALCVWAYSLRPDADGRVAALELLGGRIDALVTTVLASGGSTAADADDWRAEALEALGVPVIQALCATTSRARWAQSDSGLTPLDAAMQVAIPEFDGRIVGVPVSFKEPLDGPSPVGTPVLHYAPDAERCARLAELAVAHARLRRLPAADKRVALVLSSFPTKHGRIGNAVGLDTPASAIALLDALAGAGYDVERPFADGDALIHALIAAGGHDEEFLTDAQLDAAQARLPVAEYAAWFATLPQALQDAVTERWGPAPGTWFVHDDAFVVAGLRLGNVFVAIQPPRGYGENPVAIYHDPELPPAHHYLATYLWLRRTFGAHAIVHLGKHGTLEWLPGKGLGLGAGCAPDAALAGVPLFYPFVVDDPGEGVQAKRRAHAVVVDHLVPPMMRAETYDELAQLEQLLDEYARCEALDPPKLPALASRIWTVLHEAELHRDLGLGDDARQPSLDEFGALIEHVDGYLCEIKDLQVRDGLHVLGRVPEGEQFDGLLAAILRLGSGDRVPGLRRAIGAAYGLDEPALTAAAGELVVDAPPQLLARFPGPSATGGDLVDRLHEAQTALVAAFGATGHDPARAPEVCAAVLGHEDPGVVTALRFAGEEVVPRLHGTSRELERLLDGLDGRHVPSGPSGSPTRGRVDVLPTGKNFHSVDPKALPSDLAHDVGTRLAEALLRRELDERAAYPETVGIVMWGTSAMRTHGDDAGEVLALLGVRPVWHRETRRVTGVEPIPLEELGRPRIDVAVRISGFFRDAFPHLVTLLDDAVALVAGLDEPAEMNFVRKHALEDRDRLVAELGEDAAWRRATARVYGAKPGAYGTGLLPLLDTRSWRDDADLGQVYEVWGGHAYGRGLDGVEARSAMRDLFARIDVAVKNVDTREHDVLDSSDYWAEHGGMVAYVRSLTGRDPRAMIGDSADPQRVHARTLAEESRRVFRARVANPRWIASMVRHGYKGAFELSATVDYLFGYDATTGVVEDWMYEALTEKYVLDPDVAAFMRRSNPWALRAIAERLLEAADRGLWAAPEPETLDALREAYLQADGELEEAAG